MLKTDCIYFHGDKPCNFHKEDGRKCDNCTDYEPITYKILIIKLDAKGDVLRTTAVLPALRTKYPGSHITWCTRKNAVEIFNNNSLVNDVIIFEDDALFRINAEEYDLVINLDTSKVSSAIASTSKGKTKLGFILNTKGFVEPTNSSANYWLMMSAFDDVKRENKKSYQSIMYEILELNQNVLPPMLSITEKQKVSVAKRASNWSLGSNKKTIGLNIGVGTKWPSKGWPTNRWEELINLLKTENYNLLLLGGKDEKEKMLHLSKSHPFLINTRHDNSLMEFAAVVERCDVLVTADSLALHVGTAVGKKIVALFGPTSISEIELYGKGKKLKASEDCRCYYKKYCTQEVSCMEKISAEEVYNAIEELL